MSSIRTKSFLRRRLPHWEVERGHYFVTTRQRGSLPDEAIRHLRQLQHGLDESTSSDAVRRKIAQTMETWLARGHGRCDLTDPAVASMGADAIAHRERSGVWQVIEYVIMPNNLHLFVKLEQDDLFDTMTQFKRWTGRRANECLGRGERFWQREWFDHWSRSAAEDDRIAEYIRQNPVKAGLVGNYREWPHGSWATTSCAQ